MSQLTNLDCDRAPPLLECDRQPTTKHVNSHLKFDWVERPGNKYWYFRYCWMRGRKINRLYLGSVTSITDRVCNPLGILVQ
ncbi:MAG: hypothetical protein ACYTXC_16280 [Nostoc sp.]